ncbi:hypothetical protein [Bradyrhizobium septentrionale]|jgi:uncharacterized membrane protein YeaQ/YmgE (transglycosylase-associated protein family)|uniref:GlsB/YeaQ/YmgE family stress response membrane protein n=1 Tax=Bradyrhizobium septentrionale TaxID=1404411 RepID=A0ABZ2P7E9_9BRAD|nr:hypothetical protein [Bradyrhizobium septentrionale]UGY24873.1 hypothetical protein HU675_0044540 [Bradyrhizobium septentrionale]
MDTSFVLLIGAIAGAIGGWITSGMLKSISLGKAADTIVGLLGGVVVSYSLHTTLANLAGSDSSVSLGATVSQIVAALVGGGILTVICALLKDLLSPKSMS